MIQYCHLVFDEKQIELLTPPSLRILEIISMYSTILCAVSRKKQVTTASHAAASVIKDPLSESTWTTSTNSASLKY